MKKAEVATLQQSREKLCGVCGKNMVNDSGTSFAGISITITDDSNSSFLLAQMGAFSINKTYSACVECWLKSLGFKPEGGE